MHQKPNNRLAGQTAIVTGSSSGIGRACALALASEGANVVINYIGNPTGAEEVASLIAAENGQTLLVKADISQEEQVDRLFADSISRFGTVDILINNAGLQKDALFIDMTLDQWRYVLDVNLTGQFLCARAAAREFLRRGPRPEVSPALGKIICMSSVHEFIPWAGHANYAASKGGVMLLMKSIAQELGEHKIRVNSVAPGAIRTPINRGAWETPKALSNLMRLIPYKRIGEASDIGASVAWLASDEADYIHGHTLVVDGGMALYPGFEDNG
ncbi:SDR family oxidoreductase [Fibrella aquatilis]|uniref:SDR family oxidoreductase n=1 Tax=Fibrella aquatilis TaxID=2817059 RepID=A0A939G6X1_9BACT|nr:SDR family oxidoreductase [Fibrella aquatilis]MBO0932323.1 SDR family oxidoreductase [Fibrella aquatilis]